MKRSLISFIVSNILIVSVYAEKPATAGDETTETASPWAVSAEAGLISTSGNTETQSFSGKIDVVYEVDKWRHSGHIEGYSNEARDEQGVTRLEAKRYSLSGQTDRKFTERNYAFALLKLQEDRFSGFDYEHVASAGYGRKLIKQKRMELDVEIGPGLRFFKPDGLASDRQGLLRLAGKFWWDFTSTARFTQNLTSEIGGDSSTTKSVTGLSSKVSDQLALKFTYTIWHKSEAPVGIEKTDTETAMTLVFTY